METSPAAYGTAFVLDPATGIFNCGNITGLPETDVVTMVVEAVNTGGADEATVVFTIIPVSTQSPSSSKKSSYYVGYFGTQDEPTVTDDPPSFDESLYETPVAEDDLPINNCFSVTATSTVTPITYDTIEVSPAGYDAVFEIGQTTGVFDCNAITAGLEDTDRYSFQGGMKKTSFFH